MAPARSGARSRPASRSSRPSSASRCSAGPDARAALDAHRRPRDPGLVRQRAGASRSSRSADGPRASSLIVRIPDRRARATWTLARTRSSSSSKASRSPATSGRSCGRADGAGVTRGHRGVAPDRPVQPERDPGERGHGLRRAARRRTVRRGARLAPRTAASGSSRPGSAATRRLHRGGPAGPARDRAGRRGRRPDRHLERSRRRAVSASRCAASPTA